MSDNWLRPEFQDREDELETRAQFEQRTGITTQSLSSHFTRYADRVPAVVKTFGKLKYFAAYELDDFVKWISENSGTRSETEVKRSEVARRKNSIGEAELRVAAHKKLLGKAEAELSMRRRQLKRAEDDLSFLEQVE
jgi:hypothetical protein